MKEVNAKERYKSKFSNEEVTVSQVQRKGAGFQVVYRRDGEKYGLLTSRGRFLQEFELTTN